MHVVKRDGSKEPLDYSKYERQIIWACQGLSGVDASRLKEHAKQPLYDGITTIALNKNLCNAARDLQTVEEPNWTFVAARFVLQDIYKEVCGHFKYPHLDSYLKKAHTEANLNSALTRHDLFDIDELNNAIQQERDYSFDYLGITTLQDRYLLKGHGKKLIEMPQHFLMRVAMGVALAEETRETRTKAALDYYETLSRLEFMSSTPTLFNSGLKRSQLSSCFGATLGDDTDDITDVWKEVSKYSKFGGGVAMDYTQLRASGSPIRSMGGEAEGPVPYIVVADGIFRAFNQQGKRKGSVAPYLETWHADIFEFLDLKEPGDYRIRANDSFMSNWIPDLFMERVEAGGKWSLFDPADVPGLHFVFGEEFRQAYTEAEAAGKAKRVVDAEDLWYRMIERICAHGVFWHCYKDRMNERYALSAVGSILSSNLCTEIALRSSADSSFVCNLGSVNLSKPEHLVRKDANGKWMWNTKLSETVRRAVRFLDSVIDIGFVPHKKGENMQKSDRPIGLGCMGWTEALYQLGIDYESKEHVEYSNEVYKQISIAATYESALLAQEKGSFQFHAKSTWAQGKLIHDSADTPIIEEFGLDLNFNHCPFVTEGQLRMMVKSGMRNSTLLAIAPTATISNIVGTEACTELPIERVYRKKNLSGVFKAVAKTACNNPHGLPVKTAYNVDHTWTINAAAARQIWIDQSQSTNFWVDSNRSDFGDVVDELYRTAWKKRLKTTYYLYGNDPETEGTQSSPMDHAQNLPEPEIVGAVCTLRPGDEGFDSCEACQ
jgi:ribonucleoside-diphosphate reductase alpha chain